MPERTTIPAGKIPGEAERLSKGRNAEGSFRAGSLKECRLFAAGAEMAQQRLGTLELQVIQDDLFL